MLCICEVFGFSPMMNSFWRAAIPPSSSCPSIPTSENWQEELTGWSLIVLLSLYSPLSHRNISHQNFVCFFCLWQINAYPLLALAQFLCNCVRAAFCAMLGFLRGGWLCVVQGISQFSIPCVNLNTPTWRPRRGRRNSSSKLGFWPPSSWFWAQCRSHIDVT